MLSGCSGSPYSISRCRVEIDTIDSWLRQLARGLSALERLWIWCWSPARCCRKQADLGAVCFSWPHLSPRLAFIQPSPSASPSHRSTAIVESHDMGWGGLMSSCVPVGSCWRPVEPSWLLANAAKDAAVSPLVCCAAHLRGGLTPPPGHPLGASSWGRLSSSFIISMQVGRGSLGHPDQCSWHCTVLPTDLPCFSRGCGTHLYKVQHCAARCHGRIDTCTRTRTQSYTQDTHTHAQ